MEENFIDFIYEGDIGDIPDEVIRKWAYDEYLWLSEQDEDLLLYSIDYFPVLFEIAEDSNCPKADYALTIMDSYLMDEILEGDNSSIELVQEAIQYCKNSNRENILSWMKILERRIEFKQGIQNITRELALEMGQVLLNGISRDCNISVIEETKHEWIVELSYNKYKEYLCINKSSGVFKFKRYTYT